MLSSPRRPSSTMRIFSSAEGCRRVALRISRTVFSALSGIRLLACLIVAPRQGYDEPGFLSYAIRSFYPTSADGLHRSQPIADDPRALFTILRPCFREAIVRHIVTLDTQRILNELCGTIATVGVDCLFEKVGHCAYSSPLTSRDLLLTQVQGLQTQGRQ